MDTAKRVSQAIKNKYPNSRYGRVQYAQKFVNKMLDNARRIRLYGTRLQTGKSSTIPRAVINAMCFGYGDEHNRTMIKKYTEAARAAQRFVRKTR